MIYKIFPKILNFLIFINFLDLIAARDAGLAWTTTNLPIKQVKLVTPTQPNHSPFLSWAPPNLALLPDPVDQVIAPNVEEENVEEPEVAQEAAEDLDEAAPVAAPFRLGPVPPLNRTIIPTGEINPEFPRGSVTNMVRDGSERSRDYTGYTGPGCYTWNPVVSHYFLFKC